MRRFIAVAVAVVALFGVITPAFAQAPAPKVTINGLVDFVTTAYKNWPALDITDGGRDQGWYSRERGVFTITGEVGKAKGVWALELDFVNGQIGAPSSATTFPGTSSSFDLDTDVPGFVETKWLYIEAPITGPGSIMPFIPISTIMRAGGQPSRGHEYKPGILLGGDMPGVTFESTWAPNLRSTITYAQIGEATDKVTAASLGLTSATANEDWALLASVELDIFKGFTIKPTYAYADYQCGNTGTGNLGTEAKNGFNPNVCTPTPGAFQKGTRRHTFGGDVRFIAGPVTVQPTFLYQMGTQEVHAGGVEDVKIRAWIFDTTAGFRAGPLNIEGRVMYTPGMKAGHSVAGGDTIKYYQSINPAFSYMAGWTDIQTSGIDYATALNAGAPGVSLRQSPSYDKYGRLFLGAAVDYSLTPALTLKLLGNASWTAEKVDTDGALLATGLTSPTGGDERYLGTEINAGLTYRFAPNVALDLIAAYMFVGPALDHARVVGGPSKDADDVYKLTARVRVTF